MGRTLTWHLPPLPTIEGGREFTARRVLRPTRIGPMDPSSFADLEAVLRADAQAGSFSQRYRHTCPSLDLTVFIHRVPVSFARSRSSLCRIHGLP